MKTRSVITALVAGSLVAVALASYAQDTKIGTGDVVADRQRLMKLNGAAWKDAQDKFKAGQIDAIAVSAETMALNADHIPMLFPKGSLTDKSKAKPEIWEKWDEFVKDSKNMVTWSEKLREASKAKNNEEVATIMKDFGRQACGTCHQPFRVPPPQQPRS